MKNPRKVLGIDVGVASIGWAYIIEDENNSEIIDMGSRIVPLGKEKDDFARGQSTSINANRTRFRGARRSNQRWKQRRNKLSQVLERLDIYPSEDLIHLDKIDPYNLKAAYCKDLGIDIEQMDKDEQDSLPKVPVSLKLYHLRARAATKDLKNPKANKITLEELGRVLLHLCQKRGYQSNRNPTKAKKKEDTEYLKDIKKNNEMLRENEETFGQHYFKKFEQHYKTQLKYSLDTIKYEKGELNTLPIAPIHVLPRVKTEKDVVNRVFSRTYFEQEFNRIWENQKQFYDILTDDLKKEIGDKILFYQRPLKSQKSNVGTCRYRPNYRVAPKSSPFYQLFRIWQNLNNIEIADDQNRDHPLVQSEKEYLFSMLNEREKMTNKQILREVSKEFSRKYNINFKPNDKEYEPINFDKIEGNRTNHELIKALKKVGFKSKQCKEIIKFDPQKHPERQLIYRLWHLLYSVRNPEQLHEAMIKHFEEAGFALTEEQAEIIDENITLEGGYGSISTKFIKEILPHMINGAKYHDACEMLGETHSDSPTKKEIENWEAKPLETIPKGKLRNPIVEKILNQAINLVNELIDPEKGYGRPHEIRVELTRELKQNKQTREARDKSNKLRANENKRIRAEIKRYHPKLDIRNKHVERWKLWEETQQTCIYSKKHISPKQVFGNNHNIDHIIDKAHRFDDSYENKVLVLRKENDKKQDRTAKDYMIAEYGEKGYMEYVARVNNFIKNPRKKANLMLSYDDLKDGFINRQIKDTQYIAKALRKILENVCPVTSTTGSITAHLRNKWELNEIMRESFARDSEGKWSKRNDHRHHAVDALVVACTKQAMITHLNTLNSGGEVAYKGWDIKKPWLSFKSDTKAKIQEILISFVSISKVSTQNINRTPSGKIDKKKSKPGKKPKKIMHEQRIITPRGELHEQTIRGTIKKYIEFTSKQALANPKLIYNQDVKKAIQQILNEHNNDIEKASKYLNENPLTINGKPVERIIGFKIHYTKRIDLATEMTKPEKAKSTSSKLKNIESIVNDNVKRTVKQRLDKFNGDFIKAFSEYSKNPIYLDKAKTIPIKRVKIIEDGQYIPIRKIYDKNGQPIVGDNNKPIKANFAASGSNHHMAFYDTGEGEFVFEKVSFWDAFHRKKNGKDVVKEKNDVGLSLAFTLSINEMFVFPQDNENIDEAFILNKKNKATISKHLYRVQKLSSKFTDKGKESPNIVFRHHLATESKGKSTQIHVQSLSPLHNIYKVTINRLGIITDVQKIYNNG